MLSRFEAVLSAALMFPSGVEFVGVELVVERVEVARRKQVALKARGMLSADLESFLEEYVCCCLLLFQRFDACVCVCCRDLCGFDITRFTHVFVFGAVFNQDMLDRIVLKLDDPKAQWRSIALCVRQCQRPPTIAGLGFAAKLSRMKLHKQSRSSFTFYLYRR